ncbi:carbohydrate sulfotransferase 1-like [Alosa sapidissima]|uniref:carbohydrate sulfotransferase 1-like n=1 Tax=Alosa sapidissima TaxID=34773 RepID=UPI001C084AD5|nr:carbohydrate sulfotransferase 1-like [Alosa sapidissima]
MRCSWKVVILMAVVSIIVIQYAVIRSFRTMTHDICPFLHPAKHCQQQTILNRHWPEENPHTLNLSGKTHVLILAATRSGSSFLGQLFNHHSDVFYLYEPLNHIQTALNSTHANRRMILGASRDLLRGLFRCDLHLLEDYIRPQPEKHITDQLKRRGASKALCSPPVCHVFSPQLVNVTESQCVQKCGSLNLTLASQSCQQRGHVVIKTVRVPEVSDVRDLLEDPQLNLKVIQLVRDPRGVLASRMMTFPQNYPLMRLWKMKHQKPEGLNLTQEPVCEDYRRSVATALRQPDWLRGRYMLVRYEDLATNTLQKIQEIFKTLGLSFDENIMDWIETNTEGKGDWSPMDAYGTKRHSATNSESWRFKMSFDMVQYVQTLCETTLHQLGYKIVKSSEELENVSLSLVEDRTWRPFQ